MFYTVLMLLASVFSMNLAIIALTNKGYKDMKKYLLLGLFAMGAASTGCSYGAMAVTPAGQIVIARNDSFLFGALRKVFSCTAAGEAWTCVAVKGAP